MNCFKHQDTNSVGVCRNCFKGVCSECAIEFDSGIACSEECLEKAKATVQVIANSVLAQKGAKAGRFIGPTIVSLIGIIYLSWSRRVVLLQQFAAVCAIPRALFERKNAPIGRIL